MVSKFITKLLYAMIIIIFIILPIKVKATNENIEIISTGDIDKEYIIYIKDYTDKKYKYAFSSTENAYLVYINSISDSEGNQVAFLDAETYNKLSVQSQTIYLWAKDENENIILDGIQLDLSKSLNKEETASIELITKRIAVEITDTKEKVDATEPVRQEEIDGVDEIAKVGYVKITDSETATYYYQMVNTFDSAEFNTLMEYAERLNSKYADLNIYDKVQFCSDFYNLYSKLVEEAEWQEVENMIINQPEESVKGDKYVLLLRKVDGNEETIDAQFLTAYDDYEPNVITEQVVKEETAKLPITSDSIVLFVVLGIVVIALVVIFIRIKVLSKKENNK